MVPQHTGDEMKGKAVWLMGRRVGEGVAEGEGNGQKYAEPLAPTCLLLT